MEFIQNLANFPSFVKFWPLSDLDEKYEFESWQTIIFGCLIIFSTVALLVHLIVKKWKGKVLPEVKKLVGVGQGGKPRFRKRDKVMFYGRKMLRKVKSISGQVKQGKKRKLVLKIANRILRLKKDGDRPLQLITSEPPAEYLQEDLKDDQKVPPDAFYMLQSIRVFGHFEKPIFLKLCKHTDILTLPAGSFLFKIGEPDENVYVVQNGKVNVFINNSDGAMISLKIVKPGDSVTSLLSFTDVLTGHPHPYRTVSAKAIEDSTVVRLPMAAFQEVFQEYPDSFIRVMQVIMVRLQRVTFTALHQYLGLTSELIKPRKKNGSRTPVKQNSAMGRSGEYDILSEQEIVEEEFISCGEESESNETTRKSKSDFVLKPLNDQLCKERRKGPGSPVKQRPGEFREDILGEEEVDLSGMARKSKSAFELKPQNDQFTTDEKAFNSTQRGSIGRKSLESFDEQTLIKIATDAFMKELGLSDEDVHLLEGKVEIRHLSPDMGPLMEEESHKDVALVYLLNGVLNVSQKRIDMSEEVHMFTAHPGEIVGGLAVLTGEPSFYTIKTKHQSSIALLSKTTVYNVFRERPKAVLHIAHTVVRRLSPFVRQVDFALDWVFLESGRAVYRQGDESDCTYIVLSGRVRSIITHGNGKKQIVCEYGKGELVGIVEMVTQTPRSTTVLAIRDSELAKLPEGLFNAIKVRYPVVVTRIINLLGHRILGSWQNPSTGRLESRPTHNNFSTVAIVPVSDDVPLSAFTYELYHCLRPIGTCMRLNSEVIRKTLGMSAFDANQEYRLTSWLAQHEDQHSITLYQCDHSFTAWTQRCLRQADCVLIVGLGFKEPSIGKIELEIERLAIRTQKELVLLHKEGGDRPSKTIEWLNMRQWIASHHHILCNKRMFSRRSQFRVNELYAKVLTNEPSPHSDFSRLARWLTGTSIGLVLGGGGAKGASHVGMIKAIEEAGIPIDMVGGVSIGAFIGGLWCMYRDTATVTQKAREWSQVGAEYFIELHDKSMNRWWYLMFDLTYPTTSMFTGSVFNNTLIKAYGETRIEDLWVPYFTLSTDITASAMRVHRHGVMWRYVRASMSLSGYMPPVCDPTDGHLLLDGGYVNNLPGALWTYVRSSMSIAGMLPPLCDPTDGHLLVDGCYINNLPADVMKRQGAKHVLAIDVGSVDDQDLTNYGDTLSGWWILWKRLNPFTTPVKVPNLPDIQSRLAYVSCVRQLEEVKESDYCEYIRPPIDNYRTLQFGSFDEIKDVGYNHGKAYFTALLKNGPPHFMKRPSNIKLPVETQPNQAAYKFTDLAQMVCKVSKDVVYPESSSSSDYEADEEDAHEVGYASEPSAHFLKSPDAQMLRRRAGGSLSYSEPEIETDSEMDETAIKK